VERVLTSILRIASVLVPRNLRLAIAAQIFVTAGVFILFVINIIFAIRLVRATHQSFGWHPAIDIAFKILSISIDLTLITVITATVQSSFTLDSHIRFIDHSLQLYGSTLMAIVATLPLPIIALTLLIPYSRIDEFGTGRLRTKVIILLISATLLSVGAWYRFGISLQAPVPRTQPLPGYLGKGPFYILNFLIEFQTVIMYAIFRVDQLWHIPNGAKGPGSYSHLPLAPTLEIRDSRPTSMDSIVKISKSLDDDDDDDDDESAKSVFSVDMEKAAPSLLPIPRSALLSYPSSRPTSSFRPTVSRPTFQRQSLLQQVLTKTPTASQKSEWRASEDSRIIRRLGGPWFALPSPTESTFGREMPSPTQSTFGHEMGISAGTGLSVVQAPSIRGTLLEDWTPEIDWELGNPKRFSTLKKECLGMLQ
jgi:hypothetical protein